MRLDKGAPPVRAVQGKPGKGKPDDPGAKECRLLPSGVNLPGQWTVEFVPPYGHVITAKQGNKVLGYVTVDLTKRAFAVGMSIVRTKGHREYAGRLWRRGLFEDAIGHLQGVLGA